MQGQDILSEEKLTPIVSECFGWALRRFEENILTIVNNLDPRDIRSKFNYSIVEGYLGYRIVKNMGFHLLTSSEGYWQKVNDILIKKLKIAGLEDIALRSICRSTPRVGYHS